MSDKPAQVSPVRAKRGMPRVSLVTAETYACGVWEAARQGSAPAIAVARAISGKTDVVARGGRWRAKVTAMRAFHLIDNSKEGQFKLSDIGLAVVNSSDARKQQEGRRRAVLSVDPYASLLRQNDGHPLPTTTSISGRFEHDFELSTEDARVAAEAFIESVTHAKVLDPNGNISLGWSAVLPSEAVRSEEPAPDVESSTESIPTDLSASTVEVIAPKLQDSVPRPTTTASTVESVEMGITINMSKWPVEDILTVLKVFGYSTPGEK